MGPITKKLLKQWSKNVGVDIRKQIEGYGKEIQAMESGQLILYQFKRQLWNLIYLKKY